MSVKGVMMTSYLMDTNAFNNIRDDKDVDVTTVARQARGRVYVTHHQADEINDTRDAARRAILMECLQTIDAETRPTETFVLGKSRLGLAKLSDGGRYNAILAELNKLNVKSSNKADALIGETAEAHGWVLVSDDRKFAKVMTGRGIRVICWRQFMAELAS